MTKGNRLTFFIVLSMILGVVVGYLIHTSSGAAFQAQFATNIKLLSTIFIRLVQMIIAPLVFTTLVVGIAKLGDLKTVGRVGGKAILWFITASLASLLIGLVLVNIFEPGKYISLDQRDVASLEDLATKQKGFSLQNFVEHVIPRSFVEAMATNEILQLVVFSIFFGVAAAAIGDYTKP
ncbi:MAG TPA: cation:dicarboxylase symporter family transporter, partial [Flavisolibacter sp.]